jgi:lysophospholipase L1-like esterase
MVETADPDFGAVFEGGIEQSHMLGSLYADLADETVAASSTPGSVAKASPLDGVHLDAKNTRAIGKGLEPVVRMMLGL